MAKKTENQEVKKPIKHIAVITFRDKLTKELYEKGEVYPKEGQEVSKKRIKELLSGSNVTGQPLIKVEE